MPEWPSLTLTKPPGSPPSGSSGTGTGLTLTRGQEAEINAERGEMEGRLRITRMCRRRRRRPGRAMPNAGGSAREHGLGAQDQGARHAAGSTASNKSWLAAHGVQTDGGAAARARACAWMDAYDGWHPRFPVLGSGRPWLCRHGGGATPAPGRRTPAPKAGAAAARGPSRGRRIGTAAGTAAWQAWQAWRRSDSGTPNRLASPQPWHREVRSTCSLCLQGGASRPSGCIPNPRGGLQCPASVAAVVLGRRRNCSNAQTPSRAKA